MMVPLTFLSPSACDRTTASYCDFALRQSSSDFRKRKPLLSALQKIDIRRNYKIKACSRDFRPQRRPSAPDAGRNHGERVGEAIAAEAGGTGCGRRLDPA
jgi:hypothetical protein